jgi:hypothetical protein
LAGAEGNGMAESRYKGSTGSCRFAWVSLRLCRPETSGGDYSDGDDLPREFGPEMEGKDEFPVSTHVYEIVVKGRLSPVLIEAIGFDVSCVEGGCTNLVGHQVDQDSLHRAFRFLQDLNIELISLNELPSPASPAKKG